MKLVTLSLVVISVAVIVAIYLAMPSVLNQPYKTAVSDNRPISTEPATELKIITGTEESLAVTPTGITVLSQEPKPSPPGVVINAPVGLIASPLSANAISLAWNDNSDNEASFKIERRDINSAEYMTVAAVGAGVAIYTDNGLKPSTGYYYRVRAFAEPGYFSPYSNEAYVVTLPVRSVTVFTAVQPQPTKTTPADEKPATRPSAGTDKKESPIVVIEDTSKWTIASGGFGHSVALKTNGTLWVWGEEAYTNYKNKVKPVQVGTDTDWAMIACGFMHIVALKSDGTIWAYRSPFRYVEDKLFSYKPLQIDSDSDWVQIASNLINTIAIKTNGTLWMWNDTIKGAKTTKQKQPKDDEISPVQIGNNKDWAFVASGGKHNAALKLDGSLWTWGYNNEGQLGLSDTISRTMPVSIISDPDWLRVACGDVHTIAIKKNGSLWGWGRNDSGQLGLGHTFRNQTTPVQIGVDADWTMVAAGGEYTVALKKNGTLWAWGTNYYGQLGLGDYVYRDKPTLIGTDADWEYVACGWTHTLAIKTNGTMWAWGDNSQRQLGFLVGQEKLVPTQVAPY